jgi:hypothetical protein
MENGGQAGAAWGLTRREGISNARLQLAETETQREDRLAQWMRSETPTVCEEKLREQSTV